MMDKEPTVRVEVDVELTAVGAEVGGAAEGGEGVLRLLAGGPPVGDDFGVWHGSSLTSVALRRLTSRACL